MEKEESLFFSEFHSFVKPLVSEDKDIHLALASMVDISSFIPDINTKENVDLLPIAFNACVANRVNKNGDVIDTETAIKIYKNFINKPINIEHNRKNLIGVILTAGFSEFGTDLPLTEEQIKNTTSPFNITLGGVLWRVVDSKLTDLVEESGDETSEFFQKISASWELGFSDFDLLVINGSNKNIDQGTIVPDADKEKMIKHLKSYGGSGKISENNYIYRKVKGTVIPLGIGLTENPAADVSGVSVKNIVEKEKNISLSSRENVLNIRTFMNITSIQDIVDEKMAEISASSIKDFIQKELDKASEQYVSLKNEKENAIAEANQKIKSVTEEHAKLLNQFSSLKGELEGLKLAESQRIEQEIFSSRMSGFDQEYDLTSEDREIIAQDIKGLSDETFAAYKKKMAILMKEKKKGAKKMAAQHDEEKEMEKHNCEEAKASSDTASSVIEEIIDSKKEKAQMPNTISTKVSLFEKYQKAFGWDQFEIKL
jgi:hypothetical protein